MRPPLTPRLELWCAIFFFLSLWHTVKLRHRVRVVRHMKKMSITLLENKHESFSLLLVLLVVDVVCRHELYNSCSFWSLARSFRLTFISSTVFLSSSFFFSQSRSPEGFVTTMRQNRKLTGESPVPFQPLTHRFSPFLFLASAVGAGGRCQTQARLSKTFVGLILLPIIGNAVEHITAVTVAMKVCMCC